MIWIITFYGTSGSFLTEKSLSFYISFYCLNSIADQYFGAFIKVYMMVSMQCVSKEEVSLNFYENPFAKKACKIVQKLKWATLCRWPYKVIYLNTSQIPGSIPMFRNCKICRQRNIFFSTLHTKIFPALSNEKWNNVSFGAWFCSNAS